MLSQRTRELSRQWWLANRTKAAGYQKAYEARNRDKIRERRRLYRKNNAEAIALRRREYRTRNRSAIIERKLAWYAANPEKKKAMDRRAGKRWGEKNGDKKRATCARRHAAKLHAIPGWADREKIERLYAEAIRATRDTGQPYHVDHIVPLQSPIVCGLHCEANLQVLAGSDNQSKGNKRWPDMP